MAVAHNLGFPRIGRQRELKQALEAFWRGDTDSAQLQATARQLRQQNWQSQQAAGMAHIPAGDFALYDHMLDMSLLLGAVPERFELGHADTEAAVGFALARGTAAQPALEMTKWFDTNYHYLVPEFNARTKFRASTGRLHADIAEARMLNIRPKVVLVGP